ncbi:unnamed protein product [Urochloa humidicola]
MASPSGSAPRSGSRSSAEEETHVANLLEKLNLTQIEGEVAALSDDEEESEGVVEWAVIGKVLSPTTIHITTTDGAMRPAWGNPYGLRLRTVGEKAENLFFAEFSCQADKMRALNGSPWIVGKHAIVLREYDENLKPSDVSFARMELWVHILNLPFGWMNVKRATRAAELIGEVAKIDSGADGKLSGAYARVRVAVEVDKPLRRGVLLKTDRSKPPEWYEIQYEKLPFYCYSYGLMGHTDLGCPNPAPRNANGKLPYDVKLRAPEDRRRRLQSFGAAAVESFGSSYGSGRSSSSHQHSERRPMAHATEKAKEKADEEEVTSPLKKESLEKETRGTRKGTSKQLFQAKERPEIMVQRKRKPEGTKDTSKLNSSTTAMAIVPAGLVSDRLAQLGDTSGQAATEEEVQKKQKVSNTINARSAAAAKDSPRRAQ